MDEIGHISVCDLTAMRFTKWIITFAFSTFFMKFSESILKLNFFLMLLLGFLILVSRKIWWPNSKIFQENFEKWAWPPCVPLMVWGLLTRPKIRPTRWTFWVDGYLEIMFSEFFRGDPPFTLKFVIPNMIYSSY